MPRTLRSWIIAVAAFALASGSALASEDGAKLALVIGGADDAAGRASSTASADAGLVAQALAQAGFEVTAVAAADAPRVRKAAAKFTELLRGEGDGATAFVYIAGAGVQWSGENFFVPVGADIGLQAEVPTKAVPLAEIFHPIEALPAHAHVFAYDLAHDAEVGKDDAMPLAPGLAMVRPPAGSLYAFNAAPGMVAAADVPPFGRYARALAEALRTPGLTMRGIFERVRLRVAQSSDGAIVPWHWSELDGETTPLPARGPSVAPPIQDRPITGLPAGEVFWAAIAEDSLTGYDAFLHTFPDDRLASRIKALAAARIEAMTWSAAVEANTPEAYWTYMLRYPRGAHYVDVRRRLDAIHAALAPPPRFNVFDFAGLRAPPAVAPISNDGRAVSIDTDRAPLPPLPLELAPPAPPGFAELPPPPLFPKGALPISLPLPAVATTTQSETPARIEQMLVPHLGGLSVETTDGGAAMLVGARDRVVSRITTDELDSVRLIVQTDAAGHVQARTRIVRDGRRLTTVQTDATNEVLLKIVAATAPDGDRTTTLTNGRNQLVAETETDTRGVETVVTFGTGAIAGHSLPPPPLEMAKPRVAAPRPKPRLQDAEGAAGPKRQRVPEER